MENKEIIENEDKLDKKTLPTDEEEIEDIIIDKTTLFIVQKQLAEIGLNSNLVNENNYNWVLVNENGKKIISCPILYEFIKNNLHYIFVKNKAKESTLRYLYLNGYYKLVDDNEFKGIIKQFIPLLLQNSKYVNEIFKLLCLDLKFVEMKKLNDNENIINFNNGILCLDTGELKPHSPKYLSTIRIPCNYKSNVLPPTTNYFDSFMNTLTNQNEEIRKLLLQFMGVVISNVKGYRMKKSLLMTGQGDSGKSVLKNFLTKLIGEENYSSIDLRKMESHFGRINLLNKRLVGSNDMSYLKIVELETFKQATGSDPIHGEYKGENGINFIFNGVLWFCTNQLPKFGGDQGDWVYNRIVVVECPNVIPDEKQDKKLVEHLLEEKDYIVSLAINELQQVIKNGYRYNIPESCNILNEKYKDDNNSFRTFLNECCTTRNSKEKITDHCTKGKIYKVYKAWYRDNFRGEHFSTTSEVKTILQNLSKFNVVMANHGNEYYRDITLTERIQKEYSNILEYGNYSFSDLDTPQINIDGIDDDEKLNF